MNYLKIFFNFILCLLVFLILNFKCEGSSSENVNESTLTFLNVGDNPITFNLLINNFTFKDDANIKDYKSLILNKNDSITYLTDNNYYIYNFFNGELNTIYSEGWFKATNNVFNIPVGLFSSHEQYSVQFNFPNSDLWDTSLDFIRNDIDRDKTCYQYDSLPINL